MLEKDIQNLICEYLEKKKHMFWRSNNTPVYDAKRGTWRKMPKYSLNGTPDITIIKDGMYIGLEIKAKNGRQSKDQENFQFMCEMAGGEYYIIRCLEDVIEVGL